MPCKLFHSKSTVFTSIFLFLMLIFSESVQQLGAQKTEDFDELIREGKNYYAKGEYDKALIKFLEAENFLEKTTDKEKTELIHEFSRIYLNLALTYYATNQMEKAQENLQNLFSQNPDMSINEIEYPLGFIDIFNKIKAEYAEPEEEKKPEKTEPEEKEVQKEEPEPIIKEKPGKKDKKKKKFPWLIAGGLAVAGGVAAALLLGGEKEAEPQIRTIGVMSPSGGDIWYKGFEVDITWNSSALSLNSFGVNSLDKEMSSISKGFKDVSSFKRELLKKGRNFKNSSDFKNTQTEKNACKESTLGKNKAQSQFNQKKSSECKNRETIDSFKVKDINRAYNLDIKGVNDFKKSLSIHKESTAKGIAQAGDISDLNVRIELFKGGSLVKTIVSSTENDGYFTWTVPKSIADGTDYKVRVSSIDDSSVYSESGKIEIKDIAEWIEIPAGWFKMGDNFNEGSSDERPVHSVYLDKYDISKYEVTFDQYDVFCDDTGRSKPSDSGWGRGDRPVINVTWDDAKDFCDWLSQKTGEDIHLPTEAQWEKAARGTDQRRYPWGNGAPNCNKANYYGCKGKTMPVGSYPAGKSPYGVHDMAGNVWEWCQDWYDYGYYSRSPSHNPQGPSSGSGRARRGGSWSSNSYSIRSANRYNFIPIRGKGYIGFRLCKEK